MKFLFAAAALMISSALATYVLLSLILRVPGEISSGVAGLFIASIGPLSDSLQKSSIRRRVRDADVVKLPTFRERLVGPIALSLVGGLMVMGAIQIGAALAGFFVSLGLSPLYDEAPTMTIEIAYVISFLSAPFSLFLVFWVAHWLARHARNRAFLVCALSTVFGVALSVVADSFLLVRFFGPLPDGTEDLMNPAANTMGRIMLSLPIAIFGCYRGRRLREILYLKFLIDVLPEKTKGAVYSIVAQEAQAILDHRQSQQA